MKGSTLGTECTKYHFFFYTAKGDLKGHEALTVITRKTEGYM